MRERKRSKRHGHDAAAMGWLSVSFLRRSAETVVSSSWELSAGLEQISENAFAKSGSLPQRLPK